MQTFKILYLIESLNVGGSEVFVERLVSHIDRTKFTPLVCCLVEKGMLGRRVEDGGTRVMSLGWKQGSARSTLATVERLIRVIKNERIDLVHSFFYRPEILGVFSARLAGAPVFIASQRDLLAPGGFVVKFLWRISDRLVTHVVANSEACRLHREKAIGRPRKRTTVIYNGLPAEKVEATTDVTPPAEEGNGGVARTDGTGANIQSGPPDEDVVEDAPGKHPVVTFAGRLHPVKGPDIFVKAAALVWQRTPDVRFLVVGDGSMRPELLYLCRKLGLDAVMRMRGSVPSIARILTDSSIVVCSSRSEGFPTVLLEAMALGIPVVAPRLGGICELVDDGVDGFLFESENVTELAGLIGRLLHDRRSAVRAGLRAREKVLARFRFEDTVSQTEELYLRFLARRGGSPAIFFSS